MRKYESHRYAMRPIVCYCYECKPCVCFKCENKRRISVTTGSSQTVVEEETIRQADHEEAQA